MSKQFQPSYLDFNIKEYPWKIDIDYRENPTLYLVGKGEQGVLICEPYKSEIGQFWRFKNVEIAKTSSETIYKMFEAYIQDNDIVGADIARKYLQMGFTRARRYANYKGGKKYDKNSDYMLLPIGTGEDEKAKSAQIFYEKYKLAEAHPVYSNLKSDWKKKFG